MKKSFLMFLGCCLALSMWAADMPKQGFGLHVGWAQPILRLNEYNPLTSKDSLGNVIKLNGLKVGFSYDASFIAGFGSTMGVNYTFAGAHTDWQQATSLVLYPRSRTVTRYHEIEVFVDWQYKFEVAQETYLMLYTGPSIQYGIAFNSRNELQTENFDGTITTTSTTYARMGKNEVDQPNQNLKQFNVTWGIGAGFQYQRYFVRGGYEFGLLNPYANQKFVNPITGTQIDRYTRGRLDQWTIKVGIYLWYED